MRRQHVTGGRAWYAPRMERLVETASGLRHLRWAREILATLEVHHEHNGALPDEARDCVLSATVELRGLVNELSAAVKASSCEAISRRSPRGMPV